jgi:hypothetical protein
VKITEVASIIRLLFFRGKIFVAIFTNNGLGYILDDFFKNALVTDVMILKIFSPKNLAKILAFLTQSKARFFKNCDHNIGF